MSFHFFRASSSFWINFDFLFSKRKKIKQVLALCRKKLFFVIIIKQIKTTKKWHLFCGCTPFFSHEMEMEILFFFFVSNFKFLKFICTPRSWSRNPFDSRPKKNLTLVTPIQVISKSQTAPCLHLPPIWNEAAHLLLSFQCWLTSQASSAVEPDQWNGTLNKLQVKSQSR